MKTIRLLFKDTKSIVTTSMEEIADDCTSTPAEIEIMKALKEMEREKEIAIIPFRNSN